MSLLEALGEGLQVTVIGLLIVFSVLIILMIILMLMKVVFYRPDAEKKPQAPAAAPAPVPAAKTEPDMNEDEHLDLSFKYQILPQGRKQLSGMEQSRFKRRDRRQILRRNSHEKIYYQCKRQFL